MLVNDGMNGRRRTCQLELSSGTAFWVDRRALSRRARGKLALKSKSLAERHIHINTL